MNHGRIAAEALRYRLNLVRTPLVGLDDWDVDEMAGATVAACDAEVDAAIRQIATAWIRAGFEPEALCQPWDCPESRALFHQQPELVDALDNIVRVAIRLASSRAA